MGMKQWLPGAMAGLALLAGCSVEGVRPSLPQPKVVAHRAGTADAPENTLLAIRKALANQSDVLWLSVQVSADGVAVFDLLKTRRPDMMVFANRDAVRVNPRFAEMIIPVEWREEYKSKPKTRETLQLTNRAVAEGKVTVLFPSGRIAYWANGKLNERPWKTSAVGLARKYNLPILPVHLTARNSGLFYWFAKWSTELRDMTVFHELLNKRGDRFDFLVGNLIPVEHLDGDVNEVTKALEKHTVFDLAADGNAIFSPLVSPNQDEPLVSHSL